MAAKHGEAALSLASLGPFIAEALPSGLVVQDPNGRVVDANPAALRILGVASEQLLGQSTLHPDQPALHEDGSPLTCDAEPALQALRSGQAVGAVVMGVFNPRLDGYRWLLVHAWPLHDPASQALTGVCTSFHDITRRVDLETQARQSQAIIESSEDAIVGSTLDGRVTSWNPKAEALFGYTAEEMVGHSLAPLRPADRQQEEEDILRQIRKGQVVEHFETVRVRKDGRLMDVDITISPVRNAAGAIVGTSRISRDITRQKHIERALHDKDAEFRIAVETSGDGFWIADSTGHLLEVNDAYARLSGYSRQQLLAMRIGQLDCSDSPQDVQARMQRIVRNGSERFVTVHMAQDGHRWPVEVVASYATVAGGRFFCFIKDLTEQQNSAELIWHQANFDRLTDLPNRALFFDRLSQECSGARRNGKSVALLFGDLDAFKAVNDHHGHDAGDVVLRTVASRWLACVRATDTVARLGGDEFAIIAGNLDGPAEAEGIAQKLIAAAQNPIALPDGLLCTVGASVGIAMYPGNAVEMDSLLAAADKAMYVCKARGKNTYAFADTVPSPVAEKAHWISFTDAHLVGVAEIDAQHRELVRMANELNREISASQGQPGVVSRFDMLIAYVVMHFKTEHGYMVRSNYPGAAAHDYEHGQLVTELRLLAQKSQSEGDLLVLQKIKDWLLNHILHADKALGAYLNTQGIF